MPHPEKHILICSNNRGPGHPRGSCGDKGGDRLVGMMKDLVRENGLKERVLVSRTGCLKRCSRGVTAAVYPDSVWYQGLQEGDLEEVCREHLMNGAPVVRLLLPAEAPWE